MEEILEVLLDAFLDTLKVFAIVLVVYFVLSFIESKIANKITKKSKVPPILGGLVGLIPECGFSVVAADMYKKRYITMGTLLAVFIACSDEALPIMLSNFDKIVMVLPLLAIKFTVAIIVGYFVDFIIFRHQLIKEKHEHNQFIHTGCCHHEIEQEDNKQSFLKSHVVHPLVHTLKITLYVFIINILFGFVIYFIGENAIKQFLDNNVYLTPLLSSLVGLIPNCASSVIITQLYLSNSLSFAATISGLICNAGLGLIFLFKEKKLIKDNLIITLLLVSTSLIFGYIILFIEMAI